MAKYRKLPEVVEAIQWSGKTGVSASNLDEIKSFVGENNMRTELYDIAWQAGVAPPSVLLYIRTLEGEMLAMPKDFILKGASGQLFKIRT